jgi:serine/threonine protein kinase
VTQSGEVAGRLIGKYVVKRELGRGGMGAVYLAEQPSLGREVAIKELSAAAAADPSALARFIQEAQVMGRTSHPNIVQVHDLEQVGAASYLILEYVQGRSLREYQHSAPLSLAQSFALMKGLLDALDYAHRHNVVHRDVKPENVLVSGEGDVKVADFGVARLTDEPGPSTATRTGTTVGTPQYMSPEQVSSSKVDGRSDLYSAGIVLYELVCGRPPFTAAPSDGPFTLMAKHAQAPPPPPALHRPGLDGELERVMLKALSKSPDDRYQTGADFARELAAVADRLTPGWEQSLRPAADIAAAPALTRVPTAPVLPAHLVATDPSTPLAEPPPPPVIKKRGRAGALLAAAACVVATLGLAAVVLLGH